MEKIESENVESEKVLTELIPFIEEKLDTLNKGFQSEYIVGVKTAFIEILEIIQRWEKAALYGLDYNIEQKYPIGKIEEEDKGMGVVPDWPFSWD